MNSSYNVLVIESVETELDGDHQIMKVRGTMNTDVQFHCTVTGNKFSSIQFIATGTGYSHDEALRKAIENFMNGQVKRGDFKMYDVPNESVINRRGINHLEVQLAEPWFSLFHDLFDISKWAMPQSMIPFHEKQIN